MEANAMGRYVRERDRWNALEWIVPIAVLAVGSVNVYAGLVTGGGAFTAIGASFVAVAGLYFSVYWQPVLYLLVAVYVLTLGGVWVLSGVPLFRLGVLTGALSLGLFAVCVRLYVQYARTGHGE